MKHRAKTSRSERESSRDSSRAPSNCSNFVCRATLLIFLVSTKVSVSRGKSVRDIPRTTATAEYTMTFLKAFGSPRLREQINF